MISEKLRELEMQARSIITDIVPMMGGLEKEGMGEIHTFLDGALEKARTSLSVTRQETERRLRSMSLSIKMAVLFSILLMNGCGMFGYYKPTESQKQLNAQNLDAGKMIVEKSVQPEIKEIGQDVSSNSKALETALIGEPEVKKPYSHEASAQIRTVVIKEYDESKAPWYKKFAGYLISGIGILAAGATLAARYFPATSPIAAILGPVASTLVGMKQDADAMESDTLHIDDIQKKITALTKVPGVGPVLSKLLAKAQLDQLVHSPEAADPPAPAA